MKNNDKTTFELTDEEIQTVKSTFSLDVLAHVLAILRNTDIPDKLAAEDFREDEFWMLEPQHQYQKDKFLITIDDLVKLDLFPLTKYGVDLDGHCLYQRDDINHA